MAIGPSTLPPERGEKNGENRVDLGYAERPLA
jgi:hypothetical protein